MGKRVKTMPKRQNFLRINVGLTEKKKDANSRTKIPTNRLTTVPGILSYGIKATATKVQGDSDQKNILRENLHGLFTDEKFGPLRRSTRIKEKNPVPYCESPEKVTSPEDQETAQLSSGNNFVWNPNFPSKLVKSFISNKPNSLFKQIVVSAQVLNNSEISIDSTITEQTSNFENFNRNLNEKIKVQFQDMTMILRKKINETIEDINDSLMGKHDRNNKKENAAHHKGETDNNFELPQYLFSPQDWQFATPPSQKLNVTIYAESAIKPAFYCNDETGGGKIFKLRKDFEANLINTINTRKIELDNRYLEPVAEFDQENKLIKDYSWQDVWRINDGSNFENNNLERNVSRPRKIGKRLRFPEDYCNNRMMNPENRYAAPPGSPFMNLTNKINNNSVQKRCKTTPRCDIFNPDNSDCHSMEDLNIKDGDIEKESMDFPSTSGKFLSFERKEDNNESPLQHFKMFKKLKISQDNSQSQ